MNTKESLFRKPSIFDTMPEMDAGINSEEKMNVEEPLTDLPVMIGYPDSASMVKALQHGLNGYDNVNIAEDGIYGPKTKAAIATAGFSVPLSVADFTEIITPASNSASPAAPASPSSPATPAKPSDKTAPDSKNPPMYWIPFGVKFSKNTSTEKAFVWGIWLVMVALLVWGGIVIFGEKKK